MPLSKPMILSSKLLKACFMRRLRQRPGFIVNTLYLTATPLVLSVSPPAILALPPAMAANPSTLSATAPIMLASPRIRA
ncbi:hypothetical protein V6N13_045885 [Hibiscus sabdariffa]|uniref:Uncharacterized protein n=1 Tax=Hibiscus sabdariffa TaxID=183260 RepID=A0ABR2BE87_9ROSI